VLEVRNEYGFSHYQEMTELVKRASIQVEGLADDRYEYKFEPGPINGTLYFALFTKDDFFWDSHAPNATVLIDGIPIPDKKIHLSCNRRRLVETKVNSTSFGFDNGEATIEAGSSISINVTSASNSTGEHTLLVANQIALKNIDTQKYNFTYYSIIKGNVTEFTFPSLAEAG